MKNSRPLAATIALVGILAAAAATARAETATLEIKRLSDAGQRQVPAVRSAEYLYRSTYPQSFTAAVGPQGSSRISFGDTAARDKLFKKLVTKEPKFESEYPFRGVFKLGTHDYAFVLDAVPEKPKDEEKPAADKEKAEKKEAEEAKSDSSAEKSKDDAEKKEETPKAIRYNRLYFDLNHNGDLTDDKVIEAQAVPNLAIRGGSYANFNFPQIELTVDADGTPVEYAFTVRGYMNAQKEFSYAGVQLNAAAYREGEITLDGKTHRVALIDFNSNGRFDDQTALNPNVRGSGGQLYPERGDMLLIDPEVGKPDSPYNTSESSFRHDISKLVNLDGNFFEVKITPAGDKITMEPSTVPLGKVSNPNGKFSAVIYGDMGFLKISGDKENPAPVPAGEWKLLSYTIDMTPPPEPKKPDEEKAKSDEEKDKEKAGETKKKAVAPTVVSQAIRGLLGGSASNRAIRKTIVSAGATAEYKAVTVSADETVEMPFGPPFKPVVETGYTSNAKQQPIVHLSLDLVGSAGEHCTNMTVNGARPGKPEFTITDTEGKVVDTGSFEYG